MSRVQDRTWSDVGWQGGGLEGGGTGDWKSSEVGDWGLGRTGGVTSHRD